MLIVIDVNAENKGIEDTTGYDQHRPSPLRREQFTRVRCHGPALVYC